MRCVTDGTARPTAGESYAGHAVFRDFCSYVPPALRYANEEDGNNTWIIRSRFLAGRGTVVATKFSETHFAGSSALDKDFSFQFSCVPLYVRKCEALKRAGLSTITKA